MNLPIRRLFQTFLLVGLFAVPVVAQDNSELEQGLKPFGTFHGGDIDSVSMTNGNLTVHGSLFSFAQRGGKLRLNYVILYNNKGYYVTQTCNRYTGCNTYEKSKVTGVAVVDDQTMNLSSGWCQYPNQGPRIPQNTAQAADGATHQLLDDTGTQTDYETIDASAVHYNSGTFIDSQGTRFFNPGGAGVIREDSNGNQISQSSPNTYDTLNRLIPARTSTTDFSHCTGPLPTVSALVWNLPGPNAGTSQVKFCNANVSLQTNFGDADFEYSGTKAILQSIVLPNNQTWTFEYNSRDPGDPSTVNYGDLTKITFPTGGTISYVWMKNGLCPKSFALTSISRWLASRTVDAADGTGPHTWTYSYVSPGTIVTDPLGNDTVYTVTGLGGTCSYYVTQAQYYNGSHTVASNLAKTVSTNYSYEASPYNVCVGATPTMVNVLATRVTTSWPGGKTTKIEDDYDSGIYVSGFTASYGKVTAHREYDYGSGAPGALLRQTINSYLALANSTYKTNHLIDLASSSVVQDGVGAQKASTTYAYDGAALAGSGITTQLNSSPADGAYRGNLTSVSRWLNPPGTNLTSTATFFDTGTIQVAKDPNLNPTTYAYSSAFAGAYPTTVTNALGQASNFNYDFNTGLKTSVTDPNSQTTSYIYDNMQRLTQVNYPDGGQSTLTYNDLLSPVTVSLNKKITSGLTYLATGVVDGLGRTKQTRVNSDPVSPVYVDTAYDADGRKATVSNPYRSTGDSTYGVTTYNYDGLARVTKLIPPDGSGASNNVSTVYADNCTTVTDQQLKARKSCRDGLGRLIQVFEDPAGLNYETDYQYDTLDNLATVLQSGSRQRTFVYDSLSRLTSATNPEAGATSYTYDNDSNLQTKQDSRGITTTYSYDSLNRLTGKTYSDTTPAVGYTYDQAGCLGGTSPCYNVGRRTSMTDAAGSEAWSYDTLGRVWTDQRTTNSVPRTFAYTYNLDGSINQVTYPSTRVVTYGYNTAGQPISLVTNSAYVYAQGGVYWPTGQLNTLTEAAYNGFSISLSKTFNNRLQPVSITVATPGGQVQNVTYGFTDASGNNNGNVMSITNNLNSTRTQSFTYDQLNRIKTAGTSAWTQTFTDDIWGNLYNVAATGGATGLNVGIDSSTNRISGLGYDAAGNMTSDGLYNYVYNAENQQTSAAGVTYTYDAMGRRVKKSNGTLYWYGIDGQVLYETDLNGGYLYDYIFFGGQRLARVDIGGGVYHYFEDHLGSSRVIVPFGQNTACYDADFYPYGGERAVTNTCPQNYKFTGKERDAETGNDYFGARFNESNLGRFMSPDPGDASLSNPQSWNRYAYALNNPLSYVDPDGDNTVSAIYNLGTAAVHVFVQNGETFDAAAMLGSVKGAFGFLKLSEMDNSKQPGWFPNLLTGGGCVLGCVSTFNEEPVGITLSLSFGYDEKTGSITGVGITAGIDSSAKFIGPDPAPQRVAAIPHPGMGPSPEIFSVRIDSSVLKGLTLDQLQALKGEVSNPNKSNAIYDAIRAAVLEELRRRLEAERKKFGDQHCGADGKHADEGRVCE